MKTRSPPPPELSTEYNTIVCCTASRQAEGDERSASSYIQGAGDDSENWALGLTPQCFWEREMVFRNTAEKDIAQAISHNMKSWLRDSAPDYTAYKSVVRLGHTNIHIGFTPNANQNTEHVVISCEPQPKAKLKTTEVESDTESNGQTWHREGKKEQDEEQGSKLDLNCPRTRSKPGSKSLRSELGKIVPFIASLAVEQPRKQSRGHCPCDRCLQEVDGLPSVKCSCNSCLRDDFRPSPDCWCADFISLTKCQCANCKAPQIECVSREDSKDLSIGVALALLCLYFNDQCKPETMNCSPALEITSSILKPALDEYDPRMERPELDKAQILRRLAFIGKYIPNLALSSATRKSVNAFLMPGQPSD